MGITVDLSPKVHCEIAGEGVEYSWGQSENAKTFGVAVQLIKKELIGSSSHPIWYTTASRHPATKIRSDCTPSIGQQLLDAFAGSVNCTRVQNHSLKIIPDSNKIDDEPAFKWWVKETLKRRDRIISKVQSKYWRSSHKFGIEVPKTVKDAYRIDRETGTDFWTNAITKEMTNVRIAFEKINGVTPEQMKSGMIKPGFQKIDLHMIFDIKMDGQFTRTGSSIGEIKEEMCARLHTASAADDTASIAAFSFSDVLADDTILSSSGSSSRTILSLSFGSTISPRQSSMFSSLLAYALSCGCSCQYLHIVWQSAVVTVNTC
eukprot:scaffold191_cov273-Chaetoceros_neogracile.AAC.21